MRLKAVLLVILALVLATMPSWGLKSLDGSAYAKSEKVKAQRIPEDALKFSGMIRGVVKGKTKSGIIFWVGRIVKTWEHSKARNPEALKGKNVFISPNMIKGKRDKRVPYERHVHFMRLLKVGDEISLDVANKPDLDGNERLRLLELTEEQRHWLEEGEIPRGEKAEKEREKEREEKERERAGNREQEERERARNREREEREHEEREREREGDREREERERAENREREDRERAENREREDRERAENREREDRERARNREKEERERERERRHEREREAEHDGLPDGMHGFSGMLAGKVAGKVKNGFILKVTKVLKLWKGNEAENPESAIGKRLVILAQWRKGENGKWHPSEVHLRFIKRLETGQNTRIEVVNDEGERLHILELSKEQRR